MSNPYLGPDNKPPSRIIYSLLASFGQTGDLY